MSWTDIEAQEQRRRQSATQSIRRAVNSLPYDVESQITLLGRRTWGTQLLRRPDALTFQAFSEEVGGPLYGAYVASIEVERFGSPGPNLRVYGDTLKFIIGVGGIFSDPRRPDSAYTITGWTGKGRSSWRDAASDSSSFAQLLAQLYLDGPDTETRLLRTYGPGPGPRPQPMGGLWRHIKPDGPW